MEPTRSSGERTRGCDARALAMSLALHAGVGILLWVAPPWGPPIEEITIPVVMVLADTGSEGAAGAAGDEAQQSPTQAATAARVPGPPRERPAAPPARTAPAASPRAAVPPPRPRPPITAAVKETAASAAPPKPEPFASPSADAARPRNPSDSRASPEQGGPTGKGARDTAAAGLGAAGAGAGALSDSDGPGDDYLEHLRRHLARYKHYPPDARRAKQEGTVVVAFILARDGTVLDASIDRGSRHTLIDEAALKMLRDASPVPPLPERYRGARLEIELPVTFSIGFFGRLF